MRVTCARSRGVSENTSPVWPFVITATTPGCLASHDASATQRRLVDLVVGRERAGDGGDDSAVVLDRGHWGLLMTMARRL